MKTYQLKFAVPLSFKELYREFKHISVRTTTLQLWFTLTALIALFHSSWAPVFRVEALNSHFMQPDQQQTSDKHS